MVHSKTKRFRFKIHFLQFRALYMVYTVLEKIKNDHSGSFSWLLDAPFRLAYSKNKLQNPIQRQKGLCTFCPIFICLILYLAPKDATNHPGNGKEHRVVDEYALRAFYTNSRREDKLYRALRRSSRAFKPYRHQDLRQ